MVSEVDDVGPDEVAGCRQEVSDNTRFEFVTPRLIWILVPIQVTTCNHKLSTRKKGSRHAEPMIVLRVNRGKTGKYDLNSSDRSFKYHSVVEKRVSMVPPPQLIDKGDT